MPSLVRSSESIPCRDGFEMPAYMTRLGSSQKLPGLVFVFDVFGFGTEMKRVADEFASAGYAVLMPDLFSRGSWFSCVRSLMKNIQREEGQGVDDLLVARDWLAQSAYVAGEHLGVIGFCMGGGFALILAKRGLFRVSAPFYGRCPVRLDGACPIVGSYGGKDNIMRPEAEKLISETQRLRLSNDIKIYPEAGHGFMTKAPNPLLGFLTKISPIHGSYNAESAADATRRVVDFLRKHI